jgi:guanylate kinase
MEKRGVWLKRPTKTDKPEKAVKTVLRDGTPLLLFGLSTAGKTTLAKKLVQANMYDQYMEVDDLWKWVSGMEHPWRKGENPFIKEHRKQKNITAGIIAKELVKSRSLVVSGVWYPESLPVLERLQDYRVVVLTIDYFTAKKRFMERGQSGREFDLIFPQLEQWWDLENGFRHFAAKMQKKGKLVNPDTDVADFILAEGVDRTIYHIGGNKCIMGGKIYDVASDRSGFIDATPGTASETVPKTPSANPES